MWGCFKPKRLTFAYPKQISQVKVKQKLMQNKQQFLNYCLRRIDMEITIPDVIQTTFKVHVH